MQLTVGDAARFLNVPEETIYRWIKQAGLPAHRVSEQYRFNRAELLEWALSQKISISPDAIPEDGAKGRSLPGVAAAIERGGVFHRVGGNDRASVLRTIVDLIPLSGEIDRQFLFDVLLARETHGSTGIGERIAIPHVRSPIVLHVPEPSITVSFLETPIDFGSPDHQPVDVVLTLITPTVHSHLHILAHLGKALRDPAFKAALHRAAPRDEILSAARKAEAALAPAGGKNGATP